MDFPDAFFIFVGMKRQRVITFSVAQLQELVATPALAVAFVKAFELSPESNTRELFAAARAMIAQFNLFEEGKAAFADGQHAVMNANFLTPEQIAAAPVTESVLASIPKKYKKGVSK